MAHNTNIINQLQCLNDCGLSSHNIKIKKSSFSYTDYFYLNGTVKKQKQKTIPLGVVLLWFFYCDKIQLLRAKLLFWYKYKKHFIPTKCVSVLVKVTCGIIVVVFNDNIFL